MTWAHQLDRIRITVAIDDPELGDMHAMFGCAYERVEVEHIPPDVQTYCLWLERTGKGQL